MSDLLKQMGTRILLRRKELRLSQEQLAERAGVTAQTISTAERGEKALRPENIVKLCSALEVSPNFILLGEAAALSKDRLPEKIAKLSPKEIEHLENIIDNYIAAVSSK